MMAKTPPRKTAAAAAPPPLPKVVSRAAFPGAVASHPLVGAGVHYKNEHGCVENQAAIVAIIPSNNSAVGDLALLQYFEWMMGDASTQRLIPLAELAASDRWVLYQSPEEMNDHYKRVDEHQNKHIRARLAKEKAGAAPAD